jgi:hypothetical protein
MDDRLPLPDNVLFDVGDLGARVVTIREALEAATWALP